MSTTVPMESEYYSVSPAAEIDLEGLGKSMTVLRHDGLVETTASVEPANEANRLAVPEALMRDIEAAQQVARQDDQLFAEQAIDRNAKRAGEYQEFISSGRELIQTAIDRKKAELEELRAGLASFDEKTATQLVELQAQGQQLAEHAEKIRAPYGEELSLLQSLLRGTYDELLSTFAAQTDNEQQQSANNQPRFDALRNKRQLELQMQAALEVEAIAEAKQAEFVERSQAQYKADQERERSAWEESHDEQALTRFMNNFEDNGSLDLLANKVPQLPQLLAARDKVQMLREELRMANQHFDHFDQRKQDLENAGDDIALQIVDLNMRVAQLSEVFQAFKKVYDHHILPREALHFELEDRQRLSNNELKYAVDNLLKTVKPVDIPTLPDFASSLHPANNEQAPLLEEQAKTKLGELMIGREMLFAASTASATKSIEASLQSIGDIEDGDSAEMQPEIVSGNMDGEAVDDGQIILAMEDGQRQRFHWGE